MKNETAEKLLTLKTDSGLEFLNKKVKKEIDKFGIRHEQTVTYTPEQNGQAKRENRTLVEAVKSILVKNLPKKLWAEAVNIAGG